ncbi:serine/arginine repetitive matrix protein 3-like [Pongo pygmaeus]|uniref:serine/arginine repetitive matrix protein 3-like n=1 Tax=Pongo pygmaeus TaxID=9600 RepID=UPI00300D3742
MRKAAAPRPALPSLSGALLLGFLLPHSGPRNELRGLPEAPPRRRAAQNSGGGRGAAGAGPGLGDRDRGPHARLDRTPGGRRLLGPDSTPAAARPGVAHEETDSADSAKSPGPEPRSGGAQCAARPATLRDPPAGDPAAPQKVWEPGAGKMKAAYLQI